MDLRTGNALAGLITLPSIGPGRAQALAEHFRTWERLETAADWEFMQVLGKAAGRKFADVRPSALPEPALPAGTRVVSLYDADYPERLKAINDPPLLIWVRGTTPPSDRPALAIVGTRNPTGYGRSVAALAARQAVEHDVAIVSGLAIGVDSIASTIAAEAGAPSWVWLGQGVDTLDPRSDRGRLADRLVAAGGGVLAEVPPGTPYGPSHLLTKRNRLQVGTSTGILVAQTGLPSEQRTAGTMHTVRYTLAQRRLLAVALPPAHLLGEVESAGNVALCDPAGLHPDAIYASTAADQALVAGKQPAADLIIDGKDAFERLWEAMKARPEPEMDLPPVLL